MTSRILPDVRATKECDPGAQVTFRAKVLRAWESGGLCMCLVADASGLTRVEIGDAAVTAGASYEFRDATVRQHPGGWTSVSIAEGGAARALAEEITAPQDEAYVERTFKILSGIQMKKARTEGREPPWEHPAGKGEE
jgi:hypothetical protein